MIAARASVAIFVLAGALVACRPRAATTKGDVLELYTAGAKPTEMLSVVVLMHGYGGTPENIARLAEGLAVRARVIAPHGKVSTPLGWGWFPRDRSQGLDGIAPDVRRAADELLATLEARLREGPVCGRPIVAGFSQGGFMAYALAAQAPGRIAAAVPVGGVLPSTLRPHDKGAGKLPPVEAFHGDADEVIDPGEDRATHTAFEAAGYPGSLHLYRGVGHSIPPQMAAEVRATIERAIREEGCAK